MKIAVPELDARNSGAEAISDAGFIVGHAGPVAYVYQADFGMVDLNSLVSGGPVLSVAFDVNEAGAGQICGRTADGQAFLLTPSE